MNFFNIICDNQSKKESVFFAVIVEVWAEAWAKTFLIILIDTYFQWVSNQQNIILIICNRF